MRRRAARHPAVSACLAMGGAWLRVSVPVMGSTGRGQLGILLCSWGTRQNGLLDASQRMRA